MSPLWNWAEASCMKWSLARFQCPIFHLGSTLFFFFVWYTELNISHSEALEILRIVTGKPTSSSNDGSYPSSSVDSYSHTRVPTGQSALELLKAEQLQGYIVTFCAKVDAMLGGGIPLGKITEVCGPPGVGKTQIRYTWVFIVLYHWFCITLQLFPWWPSGTSRWELIRESLELRSPLCLLVTWL